MINMTKSNQKMREEAEILMTDKRKFEKQNFKRGADRWLFQNLYSFSYRFRNNIDLISCTSNSAN